MENINILIKLEDTHIKNILEIPQEQEYYTVIDSENLFLFPGKYGYCGYYFYKDIVIELESYGESWWYKNHFNIYWWDKFKKFVGGIPK